jgi:DNA-binding MarR family transcriptional regulator
MTHDRPQHGFQPRIEYKAAGKAGRSVFEAALAAKPELSAGEWRVLVDVVSRTALYSKTADRMTLAKIAAAVGRTARQVRRQLKRLEARGLISYKPGRGRRWSTIALVAKGTPDVSPSNGTLETTPPTKQLSSGDPSARSHETSPSKGTREHGPSIEERSRNGIEKTAVDQSTENRTAANRARQIIEDLAARRAMPT